MVILTDSDRVPPQPKDGAGIFSSSLDVSTARPCSPGYLERYGSHLERFGESRSTVAQPVKIDNHLYLRDYSKCILRYKCVEACGVDAQNTFASAVAGRGFGAPYCNRIRCPAAQFRLRVLRKLHRRLPYRRTDV